MAAAIAQIAPNQLKIKEKTDWNMHLLEVTDIKEVFNIANALHESGLVEWAHPNFHGGESTSNEDPYFFLYQFYMNSDLSNNTMHLNVESAWYWFQNCNNNPKIRVAVIDDGFEPHDDLKNMVPGYSPNNRTEYGAINHPESKHGMSCAGMIGAQHNNIGIKGINPNVILVPINIWENNVFVSSFHIAKAFLWAADEGNIDVISNSWKLNATTQDVIDAIQAARRGGRNGKGCSIVFSTGNQALLSPAILFPANQPGVVTVGGLLRNGDRYGPSLSGPELDVMAFATDIATTDRIGTLGYSDGMNKDLKDADYINEFRGTSAAAPQVAAIASLVLQANPNLTEAQVLQIIQETAVDMGPVGRDNQYGHGRANANEAVMKAMGHRFGVPSGVNFSSWVNNLIRVGGGTNNICPDSELTLEAPDLQGQSILWNLPSSLILLGALTDNPLRVKVAPNVVGSIIVSLTFGENSGGCGLKSTRELYLAIRPQIYVLPLYACVGPGTSEHYYPLSPGITHYTWESGISPGIEVQSLNSTGTSIRILIYQQDEKYLKLKAHSSNGCVWEQIITVTGIDCYGGIGTCRVIKVFPNPVSDVLNIDVADKSLSNVAPPIAICRAIKDGTVFSYQLFNAQGEKIKIGTLSNLEAKIETQNLQTGFYYVHVLEDGLPIYRQSIKIVQN